MKAQSKLINKNKQIKVNDTTASNNTQEYKLLLNMFKISYEKYVSVEIILSLWSNIVLSLCF